MSDWKKTVCCLCGLNCGLEVQVENNRIVNVRPDESSPQSRGYSCRKGRSIAFHNHHPDRLNYPLKRVGTDFVRVSWDQAITEIAEKLKQVVGEHGPKSLALIGLGGLSCHQETGFGHTFLKFIGGQWWFNALGAELTGLYWGCGRLFGRQYLYTEPDEENTEMLVCAGWNGYVSHNMANARWVMGEMASDPNRILLVIDPRMSETARLADIHLPVRPGADALLWRALMSIIIQEGWQNQEYLDRWATGYDQIKKWFTDFNVREACRVCGLDYKQVYEVARLMATHKWSIHADLGNICGRHSTLVTTLQMMTQIVTGNMFMKGGNVHYGHLVPFVGDTPDTDTKNWRTTITNYPRIGGIYPTAVLAEEIDNDHPNRIRALMISQSNPLLCHVDTKRLQKAFKRLDLVVVMDIAMTETARQAHYILPSRTAHESCDMSGLPFSFPKIQLHMRQPVLKPEGERLELGDMWTRLADAMGFVPAIPDELYEAAKKSRPEYWKVLREFLKENPKYGKAVVFIVAKTLGVAIGSAHMALIWLALQSAAKDFREAADRIGFKAGPNQGEEIFTALLEHPEGIWAGIEDVNKNIEKIAHEDKKIHLYIPELEEWLQDITPDRETVALRENPEFPLLLSAGRHVDTNSNNNMRNPEWIKGRNPCVLSMHPKDAERYNLSSGQIVRLTTATGSVEVPMVITPEAREGYALIPHGHGMIFNGKQYGININLLTKFDNRCPYIGTPYHRYEQCRVEAVK